MPWMKQLSNEAELRYNPYPILCWQARQYAERYALKFFFFKQYSVDTAYSLKT